MIWTSVGLITWLIMMQKISVFLLYFKHFLGEILRGDRPVNTRYDIKMGVGVPCAVLCKKEKLSQQSVTAFSEFIFEDYSIHL